MPKLVEFRRDGKGGLTRRCSGPHHKGALGQGTWLTVAHFRMRSQRRKDGSQQYRSWCRRCENSWRNGSGPVNSGYHSVDDRVLLYMKEIEGRLGRIEATRRCEIGKTTWYKIVRGQTTQIQSKTLAKLIVAYAQIVKNENARRTHNDIKWNRKLRQERRGARLTRRMALGKT